MHESPRAGECLQHRDWKWRSLHSYRNISILYFFVLNWSSGKIYKREKKNDKLVH